METILGGKKEARVRHQLGFHIFQEDVSSVKEGAELPLCLSRMRLSQHPTFAWEMVETRGKLIMDTHRPWLDISTGELLVKKKKKQEQEFIIPGPKCGGHTRKTSFHTKNPEDHNLNEKRQLGDANTEVRKVLEYQRRGLKKAP